MKTKFRLLKVLACFAMCLILALPLVACKEKVGDDAKITLSPTSVSVTVGETKNVSATLTGITGEVTWTSDNTNVARVAASTATNKVAVITGVAAGAATITATAGGKSATCTVTVTAAGQKPSDGDGDGDGDGKEETPSHDPQNVTLAGQADFETGWRYWCGDGTVSVSNCVNYPDNNETQITYTMSAGQWYSVQLFYKDKYATTDHDVSLTVVSPVAANVTINGQVKELVAGENKVSVDNYVGSSTLIVCFGVEGTSTVSGTGLTFTFKDLVVKSNATVELEAPSFDYNATSKVITITDTANTASNVQKYELGLFNAATDVDPVYKLDVTSGSAINLATVATGNYVMRVRAYNSSATIVTSPWSTTTKTLEWTNDKTPLAYIGGLADVPANSETWYHYRQNWEAAQTTFDECYVDSQGTVHVVNLKNNNVSWWFQLYYKATYTSCKLTITSTVAGEMTINGQTKTLAANTPLEVTLTANNYIEMLFGTLNNCDVTIGVEITK